MRKWRGICVILLSAALLFGCSSEKPSFTTGGGPIKVEDSVLNDAKTGLIAIGDGFVTPESVMNQTPCSVFAFWGELSKPDKPGKSIIFLDIELGDQLVRKILCEDDTALLYRDGTLYCVDLDGDGVEEILFHQFNGGCGGAGQYNAIVAKLEGEDLSLLYSSLAGQMDTGFSSSFTDGYQMTVVNAHTGYSLTFDAKEEHKMFFDENGKVKSQYSFFIDSFYEFEPKDVDGDGIYEIACKQYTDLLNHPDYVGNACSILKYNTDTQSFEVIDAWFEPYTEE